MSEFDKEAEREKLREKYERDQEDRETTARMSDLLLKGATMTNAHCGTCGDPIFRHDGDEFCPSCQEVVVDDGQQPAQSGEASETDGPETGVDEAQQPAQTETTANADAGTGTATPNAGTAAAEQNAVGDQQSTPAPTNATAGATAGTQPTSEPSPDDALAATPQQTAGSDGSLANARASLTRTVTRLAQQAEASDDLERARAYLAATEEAAAALDAVKQADR